FLKYAAVAILFFSIGALLIYQKEGFQSQFLVQEISEPVHSNEARLIRSGGENILLTEEYSMIEHRQDGLVIINDNLVESAIAPTKGTVKMNQLVIPYGKSSKVVLPDGTQVTLNAG